MWKKVFCETYIPSLLEFELELKGLIPFSDMYIMEIAKIFHYLPPESDTFFNFPLSCTTLKMYINYCLIARPIH